MSTEENKAPLQRAVENWNSGNLEGYLALYNADVALHGYPSGLPPGIEGARLFYDNMWAAFPGSQLTLEDVIWEGDKVAARYTMRAIHKGDFMGIQATGKEITLSGITVLRFAGDKCVERWQQADILGLMQHLNAVPPPGQVRR